MNELPLLLDEPVVDRRYASARAAARPAAWEGARRHPAWMAPAWVIGRFRPQFRAVATADAVALERYPRFIVEAGPLLLVFLLATGFAAIHGMHNPQYAKPDVEWTRLALANTYLEIPIFLLMVILIGAASPPLGVLFVLVYGVLDLAVSATQPQELTPLPGALAGRLVSLWMLWLLVVEIPIFGRSLAVSWRPIAGNRIVVAGLSALITGAFTWFWTQAAPIFVRPMFVWSDLGSVAIAAVRPVQDAGAVFAVFAGLAAGAVAYSRGPTGIVQAEPAGEVPGPTNPAVAIARGLVVAALVTIALGGLVASPFEAAFLFAALATAGPLARFVADRTMLGAIVRVTPPALRFALAVGLSFGVSLLVIGPLYQANLRATDEFFSVLFAMAIGFFLVALATTPGSNVERRPSTLASSATTLLVVGTALAALILATPVTALADNCSGLSDCWSTPVLAALAGAAVPPLLAMGSRPPNPLNRDRVRELQREKNWWKNNPPVPDSPAFQDGQKFRDDKQRYLDKQIQYWSSDPGLPPGDGKPVGGQSVASSGAGTRA